MSRRSLPLRGIAGGMGVIRKLVMRVERGACATVSKESDDLRRRMTLLSQWCGIIGVWRCFSTMNVSVVHM